MKNARTSELQLVYSRGTWRRRHTEHYFVKFNNQKNFEYANTKYDIEFPSMIMKENILATQFHPEKSQGNGKILLERFIDWRP